MAGRGFVALCLGLLVSLSAAADELRVSVLAVSRHWGSGEWREIHPGLAFDHVNGGWYQQLGGYRNSVGRPLFFLAGGKVVGPLRLGALWYDYTDSRLKRYRGLVPQVLFAWRGWYAVVIPRWGEEIPTTTAVVTYGWRIR